MTLRNGDLDKTLTVRDVLDALAKATYTIGGEDCDHECEECGYESYHYISYGDATGIDEARFEKALARRLDLG